MKKNLFSAMEILILCISFAAPIPAQPDKNPLFRLKGRSTIGVESGD